jgi:uncharacterized protein DUF2530
VQDPPPLPPGLSRPPLIALVGSVVWALAAVGALVVSLVTDQPLGLLFTTCVVGTLVGGFGYGVYAWQRAAARRGSRTAQDGVD